jgi:hypothetical protein
MKKKKKIKSSADYPVNSRTAAHKCCASCESERGVIQTEYTASGWKKSQFLEER